MTRLSKDLIGLITVLVLAIGNFSCQKNMLKTVPERHKNQQRNHLWMLANECQIDTNSIILQHQHDQFESAILTKSGDEIKGYVVQTIRKQSGRNDNLPDFTIQYTIFELPDTAVDTIEMIYHQLSIDSLVDQDHIQSYIHGYTDCTSDVLNVVKADGTPFKVAYHCLGPQDTTVSEIRYAQETMSSITSAINYRQYYDRLVASLEPGLRYNRGMFDIYKWTDKKVKEWEETYPKREYQSKQSDSITHLLTTDLNDLWAQHPEDYRSRTEDYCYEAFDVYFQKTQGIWIVMPPGQNTEVDKDYRQCRKRLRKLLRAYNPQYELLFDELRTVNVYADSIEVEDNTYYGHFE